MSVSTGFKEQQRACGFDTAGIERLRLAALGKNSVEPRNFLVETLNLLATIKQAVSAKAVYPLPLRTSPPTAPVHNANEGRMTPAMLKRADGSLQRFTGLCYTTIFKLERDGKFPARRQLSPGRVAWIRSEVEEWLLSKECVASG